MTAFVRVDASPEIGMGHLTRCMAIAEELRARGGEVVVLTRTGMAADMAAERGFEALVVDRDGDGIDGEVPSTREALSARRSPRVVLVDTYEVTASYVAALAESAPIAYLGSKRIVAPRLSAVINYSSDIDRRFYEENYPHARTCLGVCYAPLRREFWAERAFPRPASARILLMSGGSDPAGMLGALAEAFLRRIAPGGDASIVLVVGAANPRGAELARRYSGDARVELLRDVRDMAALMDSCALAVTAGGTTTYELCARRVPFVVYSLVDEQDRDAMSLTRLGVSKFAGSLASEGPAVVAERACGMAMRLLSDGREMGLLEGRMRSLAPGNGAALIAEELMALEGGDHGL